MRAIAFLIEPVLSCFHNDWRRGKVQELCSKGYSQREISQILQVVLATVNRDISYLRNQAKTNIKRYIDERLPKDSLPACVIVPYIGVLPK